MIWIGTSGYSYPEWKGSFYPSGMSSSKMLAYYTERFPTVEINNTFYRMPTDDAVAGWAEGTPPGFVLTFKAPRRITHIARLKNCDDIVRTFFDRVASLGDKLGAILFQLPPNFRKDVALLDAFLQPLPTGMRAAFEFRHPSWMEDDVFERLRAKDAALCIADGGKVPVTLAATASFGYLRLRDAGYTDEDLAKWCDTIVQHRARWKDVFVYFKHEDQGKGPELAKKLIDLLAAT